MRCQAAGIRTAPRGRTSTADAGTPPALPPSDPLTNLLPIEPKRTSQAAQQPADRPTSYPECPANLAAVARNPATVSAMICATGFTSSIRPTT